MNRDAMLDMACEEHEWDIVVIGGGATGLGAGLEAASRGYRTVVLEAVDFAKATSSRSTKLIHGGVRYLRSGQLSMVRESLRERGRLQRNAPHLVHPRSFVIPAFRRGARWYYYAGMKAYDLLAGHQAFEASRLLSRRETMDHLPTLRAKHLQGGVLYSDGQFDDSRLALALARTLVGEGGVALNYTPVTGLDVQQGRIRNVLFRDEESGREHALAAKVVVNATGIFADRILALAEQGDTEEHPKIVPSQGTHLVFDKALLNSESAIMIPDTDDGRVLFAIPWHGRTLVGTTDEPVDQIRLDPQPLSAEVDYLLEHVGRYLSAPLDRSDVLSAFSGLRPLVGRSDGRQNEDRQNTARLSREHEIHTSSAGLLSIIGGKWTTYRKMGEDVIDLAAKMADLDPRPSKTAELRLAGCPSGEATEVEKTTCQEDEALAVYGSDATTLRQLVAERPELEEPLHPRLSYRKVHVYWAATQEMARTVEDVLARRTRALFLDAQAASECAPVVSEILGEVLDRDAAWQADQVETFCKLATTYRV